MKKLNPNNLTMTKPELFIMPHLGLGDAIICAGIVSWYSGRFSVTYPCYERNLDSVNELFSGLDVKVVSVSDDNHAKAYERSSNLVLRLGFNGDEFQPCVFDQSFYCQAGIPFENRWSFFDKFTVPYSELKKDTLFIHDDPSRDMCISSNFYPRGKHIIRPERLAATTIFYWLNAIQTCEEIHCISSCFALLADSVPLKAKRKVIHAYARPGEALPTFRQNWEIIR